MRIVEIAVFQHTLPLTHPYSLSGGRLHFKDLDSTFVRLTADSGVSGWGEGCPWGSTYLPAFPGGIRAGIEELAPAILGADPTKPDLLNSIMDTALPGHPYVKSAIDVASYDLTGNVRGCSVADLLGGSRQEPVAIQSSIPTGPPREMIGAIEEARNRGYRIHSPKVGAGVAEDTERIRAIGEYLPESDSVTFDANRAWTPDSAIRVMQQTEDVDGYFEQPCETYEENLQVRRMTRQPIILDETIKVYGDVLRAARDRACEAIGLKINRVGGLTKARRIRDLCVEAGLRMNIEETGGSALADTAAVHLAAASPASHRRGTWLCHEMLTVDPIEGGARNQGGGFTSIPDSAGLGARPDLDQLGEPVAVYRV